MSENTETKTTVVEKKRGRKPMTADQRAAFKEKMAKAKAAKSGSSSSTAAVPAAGAGSGGEQPKGKSDVDRFMFGE